MSKKCFDKGKYITRNALGSGIFLNWIYESYEYMEYDAHLAMQSQYQLFSLPYFLFIYLGLDVHISVCVQVKYSG